MKKTDIEIAQEFVKAANVHPLIHANEGGVIETDKLLVDFLKFRKQFEDPALGEIEKILFDLSTLVEEFVDCASLNDSEEGIFIDISKYTEALKSARTILNRIINQGRKNKSDNAPGGDPTSASREPDNFE